MPFNVSLKERIVPIIVLKNKLGLTLVLPINFVVKHSPIFPRLLK